MLATTVRSSFRNQGQICLCGSRILIERSLYDRFREAFVQRAKHAAHRRPERCSIPNMGAVVSEAHMEKVLSYIELAKAGRWTRALRW